MSLTREVTEEIMKKFQRSEQDSGSPEVQIALLSADIAQLTGHFQTHKNDNHSRRGLLEKVNKRRKLLAYLKRVNSQRYSEVIAELGIRG